MSWATTRPTLLLRVRNPGDRAAWGEFHQTYSELIIRYCRKRGLTPSDAEDIRQTVLMSLAAALPKFEYQPSRGRFRSYLGRIVRNAIIRRAQCPHRGESALDDYVLSTISDEQAQHEETWDREWVDHHLRLAMRIIRQTHDPRGIQAFESLLVGKTTAQVAQEMEMTVAAVQKVKQRIRGRLQRLVAAQLAEEAQQ